MREATLGVTQILSDPARLPPEHGRHDQVRVWSSDIWGGGVSATSNRLVRHQFRPHTHDTLMLGMIEAGHKEFLRERQTHVAAPGTVSIVNPGDLHTGQRAAGEELRYRALYVPTGLLALAMGQSEREADGQEVAFGAGVVADAEVYGALIGAHEAIIRRDARLVCESQLLDALATLTAHHASWAIVHRPSALAASNVHRVRDLIDAQYAQDLSIDELAAAAGLSPYHLMRQFRRHIGLPIHAYQIQRRIEASKRLLASGLAVVEVALEVGFADQSHFSKRFKDLVGASPASYQRCLRN